MKNPVHLALGCRSVLLAAATVLAGFSVAADAEFVGVILREDKEVDYEAEGVPPDLRVFNMYAVFDTDHASDQTSAVLNCGQSDDFRFWQIYTGASAAEFFEVETPLVGGPNHTPANPGFFDVEPAFEYDTWFGIGKKFDDGDDGATPDPSFNIDARVVHGGWFNFTPPNRQGGATLNPDTGLYESFIAQVSLMGLPDDVIPNAAPGGGPGHALYGTMLCGRLHVFTQAPSQGAYNNLIHFAGLPTGPTDIAMLSAHMDPNPALANTPVELSAVVENFNECEFAEDCAVTFFVDGSPALVVDIGDLYAQERREITAMFTQLAPGPHVISASIECASGDVDVTDNDIEFEALFTRLCAADLNVDLTVNAVDLSTLLGLWGSDDDAADLDDNGTVGAEDLALLIEDWGEHCGDRSALLATPSLEPDSQPLSGAAVIAHVLGSWGGDDAAADLNGDGVVDAADLEIAAGRMR
ncbi:MAG: hypothetical protein VYC34_09770 [Planctomycetota bacterium]|nr:hypothetical protein [Planctomycetota bacterium]